METQQTLKKYFFVLDAENWPCHQQDAGPSFAEIEKWQMCTVGTLYLKYDIMYLETKKWLKFYSIIVSYTIIPQAGSANA